MHLEKPIPDRSKILQYLRFSKEDQRTRSIEAQRRFCERFLQQQKVSDPVITAISDESISGELKSRPGIDRVLATIERRACDVVISEDSSRLYRDVGYCLELVGKAADLKVRVICINDDVDTFRKDWKSRLIDAQVRHSRSNDDTRNRLSRTLEELWFSGAAIGLLRPGYRRAAIDPDNPRSSKTDEINPRWIPVIKQAFTMVADAIPLIGVARFLTEQGLPKYRNSKSSEWNDRNVLTLIRCEVYRGVEQYRKETVDKQNASGKSRLIPNPVPEEILEREMPHQRMVEDWLWYKANEAIDGRARPSPHPAGIDHPLYGIPRDSRSLLSTIFVCDRCTNKMYAEGRNEGGYRCSRARRRRCWNKATCLQDLTHARICQAVSDAILHTTPGIIDVLVTQVEALLADRGSLVAEQKELAKRRKQLEGDQQRVVRFIKAQDETPDFVTAELSNVAKDEQQLRLDEQLLQSRMAARVELPRREEIYQRCQHLATAKLGNDEMRPLLRRLIEDPIRAVPYQPFGNSNVVLRAEFTLQLVRLLPDEICLLLSGQDSSLTESKLLRVPLAVDLFVPSKPHQFAMQALEIFRKNPENPPTLEQLGQQLGISKRSAHLALQLGKRMEAAGITDPYVRLTECPENPSRWRFKDAG